VLVLSFLLNVSPIQATETCDSVLEKCSIALSETKKQVEISDLAIKTLKEQNTDLYVQVRDLQESANAWYKNPFILIGVGLVLGVVIAK